MNAMNPFAPKKTSHTSPQHGEKAKKLKRKHRYKHSRWPKKWEGETSGDFNGTAIEALSRAPFEASPLQPTVEKKFKFKNYAIGRVQLIFDPDEVNTPLQVVPKPIFDLSNALMPTLRNIRVGPKELQLRFLPRVNKMDCTRRLPTSEEIWANYEAMKQGGKAVWPLTHIVSTSDEQNIQGSEYQGSEYQGLEYQGSEYQESEYQGSEYQGSEYQGSEYQGSEYQGSEYQESEYHESEYQESEYQESEYQESEYHESVNHPNDNEESSDSSKSDREDSIDNPPYLRREIGSDEERDLNDYIKSSGLDAPLNDIEIFAKYRSMTRTEDGRKELRKLLKASIERRLKPLEVRTRGLARKVSKGVECQQDISANQPEVIDAPTLKEQAIEETPQMAAETPKHSVADAEAADVNDGQEQEQQQQTEQNVEELTKPENEARVQTEKQVKSEAKSLIVGVEMLPPLDLTSKQQDEEAIQLWLQQCSRDLSLVVQNTVNSMPQSAVKPIPNVATTSATELIDFEAQISQSPIIQLTSRAVAADGKQKQKANQWEESFLQRLDKFENENMSEIREPQAKRQRNRCIDDLGNKNLDHLKRTLLMPALPSQKAQGLQQIRILRPPPPRNVERLRLTIEMRYVQTFSTMSANCSLDLGNLAKEMDNTFYSRDIQVLQKRYEAAQVAWIWDNGNILISNARTKTILFETQNILMSKILGPSVPLNTVQHNIVNSQVIFVTLFPWEIALDEFSQTHALSSESIQGYYKYAYYVNRHLPNTAAKVYESGAIHVFAMVPAQADKMLEKLYLLTANHRKPKASPGALKNTFPPGHFDSIVRGLNPQS